MAYPQYIMNRHMLSYSHDERDFRFDGFFDCLGGLVSGDVDGRCVWFGFLLGLFSLTWHSRLGCRQGEYVLSGLTGTRVVPDARFQHLVSRPRRSWYPRLGIL